MKRIAKIMVYIFILVASVSILTAMSYAVEFFLFGGKNYSLEDFEVILFFILSSVFWSFICCYTSWRMGLKYKNFFLCGFAWGELTLSFLLIYPFIKTKNKDIYNNYSNKEGYYNYYSFVLGWILIILLALSYFLLFYFNSKFQEFGGLQLWQ